MRWPEDLAAQTGIVPFHCGDEFGFTADLSRFGEGKNAVLRPLLYFIEAYFDKSNSEINQKLRRRLHWLAG